MSKTTIEWSELTWNPVTGCTKVSQGCKHCYAETFYERFHGKGSFKNIICHENRMDYPLSVKKPSVIFVNSMSDLFHEQVPFSFIDEVYNHMDAAAHHTFQVLTKRSTRMVEFYKWKEEGNGYKFKDRWPLKNVWIGVSVEDQEAADERIPDLVNIPAYIHWLSCEPLLGSITFHQLPLYKIRWVVVGGESGHGARALQEDWALQIRNQCRHSLVPFFFKQWGSFNEEGKRVGKKKSGRLLDGVLYNEYPKTQP